MMGGISGTSPSYGLDSAEIYDPTTAHFTATPPMPGGGYDLVWARLRDGRVLIAGLSSYAQLYEPDSGRFSAGPKLAYSARTQGAQAAFLLPDGRALVIGRDLGELNVFDPATNTFSLAPGTAETPGLCTMLADGRILIAGAAYSFSSEAFIFTPSVR